jgi:hypothetical protein
MPMYEFTSSPEANNFDEKRYVRVFKAVAYDAVVQGLA